MRASVSTLELLHFSTIFPQPWRDRSFIASEQLPTDSQIHLFPATHSIKKFVGALKDGSLEMFYFPHKEKVYGKRIPTVCQGFDIYFK